MNIFKKIVQGIKNILLQYRLMHEDKVNKKQFIEIVKASLNDRDSFFTKYNLKVDNDNYTQIVYSINIPPEFQYAGQDWQIKDKLDETSYIVTRYLTMELGYNKNIDSPEYYHIEDPTNDQVSTQYIAVWNFHNQLKSKKTIYIINSILAVIIGSLIELTIFLL